MDYEADLAALTRNGVPQEDAEQMLAGKRPPELDFEVWPENLKTVQLFCELQTQWHWLSGMGGSMRTGLIYSEAIGYMREKGIPQKLRAEILSDLRVMERAALDTWGKASDA